MKDTQRRRRLPKMEDLNHDASPADIDREVRRMRLGGLNAVMTRRILGMLRLRAHSRGQFEHLAAQSASGACTIRTRGVGLEVGLTKR